MFDSCTVLARLKQDWFADERAYVCLSAALVVVPVTFFTAIFLCVIRYLFTLL